MMLVDPRVSAWYYLKAGADLMNAGQYAHALGCLTEALRLDPTDARAHFNRGMCLLQLGNYPEAWRELDWRFAIFDWRWGYLDASVDRLPAIPEWKGEALTGKRVLLYHEQGHGDNIMMARYIPHFLREEGVERLTIWTLPALAPLLQYHFPAVECVTALPDDLSGFDFRTPTFGIMSAREQTPDKVPSAPCMRMPMTPRPGTIGVTWSGVTQRVFTGVEFARRLAPLGAQLQSLQLGPAPSGITPCNTSNFLELAHLMTSLEHIVTVDTATVHLAGSIGHPFVHLLLPSLPDWRWKEAGRWYPGVKLYRDLSEIIAVLGGKS